MTNFSVIKLCATSFVALLVCSTSGYAQSISWTSGYPKVPPATQPNQVEMKCDYSTPPNTIIGNASYKITNTLTGQVVINGRCDIRNGKIGFWNLMAQQMNPVIVANVASGSYTLEMSFNYTLNNVPGLLSAQYTVVIP